MIRKKYVGTPPEAGEYRVVNILTKEIIVDNRTLADCNTIAHGYNHQYCKPNFPDNYFVKHKNEEV